MTARKLDRLERRWIRTASLYLLIRAIIQHISSRILKVIGMYLIYFPLGVASPRYWRMTVAAAVWPALFRAFYPLLKRHADLGDINAQLQALHPLLKKHADIGNITGQLQESWPDPLLWLALVAAVHHEDSPLGRLWFVRWPASLVTTFNRGCVWMVLVSILWTRLATVRNLLRFLCGMGGFLLTEFLGEADVVDWVHTTTLSRAVEVICTEYKCYKSLPRRPAVSLSAATEEFKHEALASDRSTIRLLLIHPRGRDAPVSGTLFEVELKHAPRFEAISYRWVNDGSRRSNILINGSVFPVQSNVHELLRDLSSSLLPRLFWIDSICINQHLDDEKSRQVRLMGDIYRTASLVTVWLGSPSPTAGADMINDWAQRLPTGHPWIPALASLRAKTLLSTSNMSVSERPAEAYNRGTQLWPRLVGALFALLAFLFVDELRNNVGLSTDFAAYLDGTAYKRSLYWKPLMHLLDHEWFERVWVVQEVVLASSARVVYGGVQIDWKRFLDGISVLQSKPILASLVHVDGENTRPLGRRSSPLVNVVSMQKWRRERLMRGGLLHFSSLVLEARVFKATHARDKIFGIQGLCARSGWTDPQYDKDDPVDVFIDSAKRVVEEDGIPELLAHAGIGYLDDASEDLHGLPSWIPDWSRPPQCVALATTSLKSKYAYRAGGSGATDCPTFSEKESRSLSLRGRLFDVVVHLAPPIEGHVNDGTAPPALSRDAPMVVFHALRSTRRLILTSGIVSDPYMHSNEPLRQVYWRLLIGDRSRTEWPAPPEMELAAWEWLNYLEALCEEDSNDQEDSLLLSPEAKVSHEPEYLWLMGNVCIGRRAAITSNGYICLVPRRAEKGDVICLFNGAQTPFVLRIRGGELSYRLVGDCYVHGIMDGKAVDAIDDCCNIKLV